MEFIAKEDIAEFGPVVGQDGPELVPGHGHLIQVQFIGIQIYKSGRKYVENVW